jgi:lycopene cyclase domain-containing protein
MTYFGVLIRFIGPPLCLMVIATLIDRARCRRLPFQFRTWSPSLVLGAHVLVALIYTTPWDNYLVANRVWWYEPTLVTGITLGWVPIEEYTFFVVQTLLAGLWLLFWMRRMPERAQGVPANARVRWTATGVTGVVWGIGLALLLGGVRGRYMGLLLVWALFPILLQLGFGGDILWHYRRLLLSGLLPPFLYLCLVDGLAIASGTWTINPENTIGWDLFGVLPLEEVAFFLLTNVLIVFGMILVLARASHVRAKLPTGD